MIIMKMAEIELIVCQVEIILLIESTKTKYTGGDIGFMLIIEIYIYIYIYICNLLII